MTHTITQQSTEELLQEAQKLIKQANGFLVSDGKVVDFGKYLTIKRYCQKHGIKDESIVINWRRRGTVPPEDIAIIEELNGLRMIRDRSYK